MSGRQFPEVWSRLMEEVESAAASGESRKDLMDWAREEYDSHCKQATSWLLWWNGDSY